MSHNIRAVLFDMDGTIMDSAPGVLNSVIYALDHFGIKVKDLSEIRGFMGPPLVDSFMKFYGFSHADAELARDTYRVCYNGGQILNTQVYEGIPQLLGRLRDAGVKVSLATSKPESMAITILEHFGILDLFDVVTGAGMEDHVRHSKTDVIVEALNRLGISENEKDSVIMVGDRKYDLIGAKECGLASIGVYFGYADPGELEEYGADHICQTVADLEHLLMDELIEGMK